MTVVAASCSLEVRWRPLGSRCCSALQRAQERILRMPQVPLRRCRLATSSGDLQPLLEHAQGARTALKRLLPPLFAPLPMLRRRIVFASDEA